METYAYTSFPRVTESNGTQDPPVDVPHFVEHCTSEGEQAKEVTS